MLVFKYLFILGVLFSNCLFAQERPQYLIKFYEQLQSAKYQDLNNIIASRADSQRFNLLASNLNPQINFADVITIDKRNISKNYADQKSISDFKEKVKATTIKKVIFKTIPFRIKQDIIWETFIDISTELTNDSIFHYTKAGISLRIPAFVSYKCFIIDAKGKFVSEILSNPSFHSLMTVKILLRKILELIMYLCCTYLTTILFK